MIKQTPRDKEYILNGFDNRLFTDTVIYRL